MINRRVKIKDIIYVFQVPETTSLDPVEIIEKGIILYIKNRRQSSTDAYGRVLTSSGVRFNGLRTIEFDEEHSGLSDREISAKIQLAIERTKRTLEAQSSSSNGKILATHHKRKEIKTDETGYYIEQTTPCDNCKELIKGIQRLEGNKHGKIARESAFIPTEDVVYARPGSRKLLHRHCAATNVPEPAAPEKSVETQTSTKKMVDDTITIRRSDLQTILHEILLDRERSYEFTGGATYLYLQIEMLTRGDKS